LARRGGTYRRWAYIAKLSGGRGRAGAGASTPSHRGQYQDDAQRIHDQLKSGADFAVLARLKSVDETSADGGLLGDVDPATLREELKSALQGLEPGQISQVVKVPDGFAILKVLPKSELSTLAEADQTLRFAASAIRTVRKRSTSPGSTKRMRRGPTFRSRPTGIRIFR